MSQEIVIRLVLDVNVVEVAGPKSDMLSKSCWNTLKYIVENRCFHIVLSPEIRREFNRTPFSPLANTWRQMMDSQDRFYPLSDSINEDLRRKVRNLKSHQMNDHDKEAMLKDIRYIEAALSTDQRILSRDDEARGCFKRSVRFIPKMMEIMWSNPILPKDDTENWLKNCAPIEEQRQLGFDDDE